MNLATVLTLSRVVVAPVFAYVFVSGYNNPQAGMGWLWISLGLLTLIELSDMFDGMAARSRNEVTDFGKVCDPVADSVSRQTVFIAFLLTGIIPLWMYLIFFYRDAFMQLLRIVCASNGIVQAARVSGKLKAVFQAIASYVIVGILLLNKYGIDIIPLQSCGRHTGFWVMLAVALYTAFSVIDYILPNRHVFSKVMQPKKM
jgi:CDP-diacylglycerol--glycerol-3-phosphate 3-phosphatidyltransferase